jgi:hypothetical protein
MHIILIKQEKMRLANLSSYDDGTIVKMADGRSMLSDVLTADEEY